MSACTFIAADCPLPKLAPSQAYPLEINMDKGTVFDGDADDNFSLLPFNEYPDYTDLQYAVALEWAYHTDARAEMIINYIKAALAETDSVELWHVWLGDLDELEERPIIKTQNIGIDELTTNLIKEIDSTEIWRKTGGPRPTFHCVKISR